MTPKQVKVMAAYFEAVEELADATETLLRLRAMARAGQIGNTQDAEWLVSVLLDNYKRARAAYEAL